MKFTGTFDAVRRVHGHAVVWAALLAVLLALAELLGG